MDILLLNLRYGFRRLVADRSFTIVVTLILALAIGANTAIFSVMDGVLLRPAPVDDLDRLVMVWETDRSSGTTREPASVPDYLDFVRLGRSFGQLAAFMAGEINTAPPQGDPVRLASLAISHGFSPMLGVKPVLGRTFTAEEDRAGGPSLAMISESLWTRSYGRDTAVIGRVIHLSERPHTIVGVMPDLADFGMVQILTSAAYSRSFVDRGGRSRVDIWTPLQPDPRSLPRDTHPIFVLGRLTSGATVASAQQEMTGIAAELERTYPSNTARGVHIEKLEDVVFGPVRPALFVLVGAVSLVLVVACVNVANLLLARGANRIREVAVCSALGASGGVLARQFLLESLLVTAAAAAGGVALAFGGTQFLLAAAPPDIPRLTEVVIDKRVLFVTIGVSLLVAFGFGMLPTLQARRVDVQSVLKGAGGNATPGLGRGRLRSALVVAEVALSVILVIGAGLLLKSFWRLLQVDPGFRAAGVLKAEYQLPPSRYPVDFRVYPRLKEVHAFTEALLRRASALPGVDAVAVAGNHPLDPGFTNSFVVVGREAEARDWPEISVRRMSPGYFRTVGLSLVRGRLLADSDSTEAPAVLLVNQAAAARFFPGRDPIGHKIAFWGAQRTIVGVVADEKFQGLEASEPLAVYVPLAQAPSANGAGVLLVRTEGDPLALSANVRSAFRELDPALAIFGVEPLQDTVLRSVSKRRLTLLLVCLFAAVALVLAVVGMHGVLSYEISRQTREIGIRIALGAQRADVLRHVVVKALVLALMGALIGAGAAGALTRLLTSLLFGITPGDPATFATVGIVMMAAALLASYIPARRAAKVDPLVALRAE
jgi:putative ABC transport system permease protein